MWYDPLKLIGQFSHDGIELKTHVKFVISHRSASIHLLKSVGGLCIVSQIKSLEVCLLVLFTFTISGL